MRAIRRGAGATAAMLAGLRTSVPALVAFVLAPLTLLALLLSPDAVQPTRRLADLERRRLTADLGEPVPAPYRTARGSRWRRLRIVVVDPGTWRDLLWLGVHGLVWTTATVIMVCLWPAIPGSLLIPLLWQHFPPDTFSGLFIDIHSWPQALTLPVLQAVAYAALLILIAPLVPRPLNRLDRALLRPTAQTMLTGELERLAETRTAALESHGAELRRIERDLHDGVQAQLVTIAVRLGLAERVLLEPDKVAPLLQDARNGLDEVLANLRGVVRGIYPPILTDRGLAGAVQALAAGREMPVSVLLPEHLPRPPAPVEAAAYFVVAEALTNTTKHSSADRAEVIVEHAGDQLRVTVRDDGRGGADENGGSGLIGIRRRVAALDGRVSIESPAGKGTVIEVELPCGS